MVGMTLVLPSTDEDPLMDVFEMLTEVASVVVHLSVVDPPWLIVVASAVKVSIAGGSTTVTVSVSLAVIQPPPLAVSV